MSPLLIIIVVCVTPLLTMRSVIPLWSGSGGRGGGGYEHKRGIVITNNWVELYII